MTKDAIINAIDEHLKKSNKQYYNQFYVGVTSDVQNRLFGAHKVPRENHWWIYRYADTEQIARDVEKHYLDLGMQGDTGGGTGDGDVKCVYCYAIANYTVE